MAQLAFAIVGGIIGGPIGWAIGAAVGQALFPGSLPDQTGPRIGDLRAQQSQYGAAIPVLYGSTRIAGNVIWSTPLLETVTVNETGKGGPSQSQTTYSYRVSMAVLLCEGPIIGIRKIWADGKLIFNLAANADLRTVMASNVLAPGITFYSGSETQEPDPTMQAYLGVANVPAYRGRAYLVLSDFQLANYGNRRPNFTFEVIVSGAIENSVTYSDNATVWDSAGMKGIATDGTVFAAALAGTPAVMRSEDGINYGAPVALPNGSGLNAQGLDYVNGLWITGSNAGHIWTSPDAIQWSRYALDVGRLVSQFEGNGSVIVAVGANSLGWARTANAGATWDLIPKPTYQSGGAVDVKYFQGQFVVLTTFGEIATSIDGLAWTQRASIGFGSNWVGLATNGSVLVAVGSIVNNAATTTDLVTWTSSAIQANSTAVIWTGREFAASAQTSASVIRRSEDGVTWTNVPQPQNINYAWLAAAGGVIACAPSFGTTQKFAAVRLDVVVPAAAPLSSIVADICTRSQLSAGDINVTALTDEVDGYSIGQQMSSRVAIEQLQRAFYFDGVESDSVIAFRKRGGASVATIAAADLAAATAGDSPPDDVSITRQQEVELPAVVSVVYVDRDSDYGQNTQQAQRITTLSKQSTGVEFAVAMSASKARSVAEALIYDAWTQRNKYSFRTSRQYAALEPGDIVTLARAASTDVVRLTKKTESRSGVIQWDAVAEQASVYTQTAIGGAAPVQSAEVRSPPVTFFVPMNGPLLRDQDDGLSFYGAACGLSDGWRGAAVYRSADSGATYDETGALVGEATIGYAVSVLSTAANPNMFDEANFVNVDVLSGTLSSASELAVLNGANTIMIGSEVLQFKGALLYATNKYQLTGLLRGRRGTEWAMSTHVTGERAVLLTSGTLRKFRGDLNAARLFKPVTIGRSIQETVSQSFTYTGQNLEPFAPVELGAGRNASNDYTINWRRRSRLGVDYPLFYDPPSGETTTTFDVEIWNSAFSTLRRTVAAVAAETTTYTAAQQAADSGGVLTSYGVRVYQLSATVGRGYVLQGVI